MNKRKIIIILLIVLFIVFFSLGVFLYLKKNNKDDKPIDNNTQEVIDYNIDVESWYTSGNDLSLIVNVKPNLIKEGDIIKAVTSDNKVIDIKVNSIETLPNYSTETIRLKLNADRSILDYELINDYKKLTTTKIKSLDYYKETSINLDCKTNTKEEGGRHTPFFSNYRPTTLINGKEYEVKLTVLDKESVTPGDDAKLNMIVFEEISVEKDSELLLTDKNTKIGTCRILDSVVKTYKYENDGYMFN